jgi:pimeloyl-ACP methyl ester carboxylesterase
VCERLGKSKVTIFGHSWGSALGALYCARYPRKVAAYVGSGQLGDWPASEALSYAYALETAQRKRDQRALKALSAIGPPPYGAKAVFTQRTWLQILDGQLGPKSLWNMGRAVVGAPESSLLEVPAGLRAFRETFERMWPEVSKLNLLELAPELTVPVFFFLGRDDHFVPAAASVAYFDRMIAPAKQLVWFETSGHEPFVDEPSRFNAAMVELVRPLAAAAA